MVSTLRKKHKTFGGYTSYYTHESSVVGRPMNFSVFIPETNGKKMFPVLYFLSGLTCTEENFMVKAGAQRYAAEHGIMLVAPDTSPRGLDIPGVKDSWDFGEGAGFYVNATQAPWDKNFRMYDYVVTELPVLIESEFPAGSARSIMGHSMGGHGALVIALRNDERYRSVSAFSPIVSPTRCAWGEKAFERYLGNERRFWEEYDASCLVRKASSTSKRLPMMVDQGRADEFLDAQLKPELLAEACKETNYPLELRMLDGYDHSYYFISTFVSDHIAFHARYLK